MVARFENKDPAAVRLAHPTRVALVLELLKKNDNQLLRQLAQRCRVRVMTFAGQVKARAMIASAREKTEQGTAAAGGQAMTAPGDAIGAIEPTGASTNLAKAIREALKSVQNNPLAGIVIITDGQNTEGDDPLAAADKAAAARVPVFTIGVGDPSEPRLLIVKGPILGRDTVWVGDPALIQAAISASGLGDLSLTVRLLERPVSEDGADTGEARPVAEQRVDLSAGKKEVLIAFRYTPTRAGRFKYSVRAEPASGGDVKTRYDPDVLVTASDQKAHVLLVAGTPTWEYQLVRALLARDKTIDLSCWLQSMDLDVRQEGNTAIDHLPEKLEELVKYDVVVLFDPNARPDYNPTEIGPAWIEMLKKYLSEHSGGLLYMAGSAYSTRFLSDGQSSGIRAVLPVSFDENLSMGEAAGRITSFDREMRLELTDEGRDHAILRFDPDVQVNQGKWNGMPGVYWTFPSRGPKPAARVLLEVHGSDPTFDDKPRPLLVVGQYGAGRTVYMGFDGSWRWRRMGKDSEYFDRFWIQMVRFLIEGKRLGGQKRGIPLLDRNTYDLGQSIPVKFKLFDPSFQPLTQPTVTAVIKSGAGLPPREVELRAIDGAPGQYQGVLDSLALGDHEIAINLPGGRPGDIETVRAGLTIVLPQVEFARTPLDRFALTNLSKHGAEPGRYFDLDEAAAALPALVPDLHETTVVRFPPRTLWDTKFLLLLLVALLSAEWAIRKRHKLM